LLKKKIDGFNLVAVACIGILSSEFGLVLEWFYAAQSPSYQKKTFIIIFLYNESRYKIQGKKKKFEY